MVRGGKRVGAGRPKGTGKKEPTGVIRVPVSMVDAVKDYTENKGYKLPLHSGRAQAGVPTAADDYVEDWIDLNSYLVVNPKDTSLVPITGNSMRDAGLFDGSIAIVDHKIEAQPGDIIMASLDGENTVKYLTRRNGEIYLTPANPDFREIPVSEANEFVVQGVVINSFIRHHRH